VNHKLQAEAKRFDSLLAIVFLLVYSLLLFHLIFINGFIRFSGIVYNEQASAKQVKPIRPMQRQTFCEFSPLLSDLNYFRVCYLFWWTSTAQYILTLYVRNWCFSNRLKKISMFLFPVKFFPSDIRKWTNHALVMAVMTKSWLAEPKMMTLEYFLKMVHKSNATILPQRNSCGWYQMHQEQHQSTEKLAGTKISCTVTELRNFISLLFYWKERFKNGNQKVIA